MPIETIEIMYVNASHLTPKKSPSYFKLYAYLDELQQK